MVIKMNKYSYNQQFAMLKSCYKNSKGRLTADGFIWLCELKPTPLSDTYTIKIMYKSDEFPRTFVVSPNPLPLALGAKRLPHTYKSPKQRLCLFYPAYREWKPSMPIATTIVHWAIQWLFYYELWRFTGKWYGGGHGNWDVSAEDCYKNIA